MNLKLTKIVYLFLFLFTINSFSQDVNSYKIINVTFNTNSPSDLVINKGRLIWKDSDLNSNAHNLKYFNGNEIVKLDSNLLGVSAAIDVDFVVWNTSDQKIKSYNMRTWNTTTIDDTYNPDNLQNISLSNGYVAYAKRNSGEGTSIILKNLYTGKDTSFNAGIWNTNPIINNHQLVWIASNSDSSESPSNIFYFDGMTTKNISGTNGIENINPILKDGQVAWLEINPDSSKIKIFDDDTVITFVKASTQSPMALEYDLSDGIAAAAIIDSIADRSIIYIYNTETGIKDSINQDKIISDLHIDNGLIVWISGTGAGKILKTYRLKDSSLQTISTAENPVVDNEEIAWTLGDAIELYAPVTFTKITSDALNGWEQTKFKTIQDGEVLYGNYDNSNKMRLFYSNGISNIQVTDSSIYKDLIMVNDGYCVWRTDFNFLWLFDGVSPPHQIVDSLQLENPYVQGGSIGFFGFRLADSTNIKSAWLYNINSKTLTKLTPDSSNNFNVLCDGNTACWLNSDEERLMFYDGNSTIPLSDSITLSDYCYRNGKIVWSESRNNIFQIMMYDVASKIKTQLTNDPVNKLKPSTDGNVIVWYEATELTFPIKNPVMVYYDISSKQLTRVTHFYPSIKRWQWVSNGKIAWTQNGNVYVFDGQIISQLTNDSFLINSEADIENEILVWRKSQDPVMNNNGEIYIGKLQPRVSFGAEDLVGNAPLNVSFFNNSWQGSQTYNWDFGDGGNSSEKNPIHIYNTPGIYSITLTVTGPTGEISERKIHLVKVLSSVTSVNKIEHISYKFELFQNYPNPFNPTTKIRYTVPSGGTSLVKFVQLKIYDVLGREVKTLVNEEKPAGNYEVEFDASKLSSGIYFYKLQAGSFVETKKMILLR